MYALFSLYLSFIFASSVQHRHSYHCILFLSQRNIVATISIIIIISIIIKYHFHMISMRLQNLVYIYINININKRDIQKRNMFLSIYVYFHIYRRVCVCVCKYVLYGVCLVMFIWLINTVSVISIQNVYILVYVYRIDHNIEIK